MAAALVAATSVAAASVAAAPVVAADRAAAARLQAALLFSSPSTSLSHWAGIFWHAYESWDMLERGL
jgi:hypothetical protein